MLFKCCNINIKNIHLNINSLLLSSDKINCKLIIYYYNEKNAYELHTN